MDKLEEEIRAKLEEAYALRKQAELAQQKAELAEHEARILQRAASLRPAQNNADRLQHARDTVSAIAASMAPRLEALRASYALVDTTVPSRRGGRQPGSISMKWRDVLSSLAAHGNKPFGVEALVVVAESRGLEIAESSARERIRRYVEQGFLMELGTDLFQVTETAIERFNLLKENEVSPDDF